MSDDKAKVRDMEKVSVASDGVGEYREAVTKVIYAEVKSTLAEEVQKAAKELVEEQTKVIRQIFEEHKAAIWQAVEEEKREIRQRVGVFSKSAAHLSEKEISLLNALGTHEEAVAKLYGIYATKFRSFADFWSPLSFSKNKRAQWINRLATGQTTESVFIKEDRFRAVALKNFHDHIDNEINRLATEKVTIDEALSITVSIEQSLIERRLFEVFDSDSTEFKQFLRTIDQENKLHSREAEDALAGYKITS